MHDPTDLVPLTITALARLRVDLTTAQQATDLIESSEGRSEWERGWAKGYAAGLGHALHIVEDFLTA
jgi:hypothetical protein